MGCSRSPRDSRQRPGPRADRLWWKSRRRTYRTYRPLCPWNWRSAFRIWLVNTIPLICGRSDRKKKSVLHTTSQYTSGLAAGAELRANGIWTLLFALETESSVKETLLIYGTSIFRLWDGQRFVCSISGPRPVIGKAKVRVERIQATRIVREGITGNRGMQARDH